MNASRQDTRNATAEEEESFAAVTSSQRADRNESQTVLRACEVLKAFRSAREELGLADVVDRTGIPKTTVFRPLRTLIHGGLLDRASSGVYRNRFGPLTARPFGIGFAAQGDSEFSHAVLQNA
jgi:DNA-binding IclR family transcriptional regulator